MREGLPIEFAPTFPLQRLDNSQMPPRRSRRNAGQKPDPLEVEAGGKKEEEVAVQEEEKTDQMPAEAVTKMVMEKKDDSLPVQAKAEAFETAEKYNVIQTEVETEKVEEGKCVPADMRRKNKMLVAKDNEVDDVCTTDAVAVAESRGDLKPEGRVDDSKSTLTEDATQVVKDDPKAGASGNKAEDDADEAHLETTDRHYGTASHPSPPACNIVNQPEVNRDSSSHRRLNASSSEEEYFSGKEQVNLISIINKLLI